jgi:hypothetical protein
MFCLRAMRRSTLTFKFKFVLYRELGYTRNDHEICWTWQVVRHGGNVMIQIAKLNTFESNHPLVSPLNAPKHYKH